MQRLILRSAIFASIFVSTSVARSWLNVQIAEAPPSAPTEQPAAEPHRQEDGQRVENSGTINGPVIQLRGWDNRIFVLNAKPHGGDFGVLDVRVLKYEGQKMNGPKGVRESRPASVLLDFIVLNKGPADEVVSSIRLRCVDYQFEEVRGGFGGDELLTVSSTYAADLSHLAKKSDVVTVPVAQVIKPGTADRFVIVLNHNARAEKSMRGTGKWTLVVEVLQGDKVVSSKEVMVQIPPTASTPNADDAAFQAVQKRESMGTSVFESTDVPVDAGAGEHEGAK